MNRPTTPAGNVLALLISLAAALLGGCVQNAAYRTTAGFCDAPECRTGSIERHQVNVSPPVTYLLGVVEFDDQGAKYERAQMDALFAELKAESATQDLCIVIFVHGWTHNASYDDPNMRDFRDLLEQLARTEAQHPPGLGNKPRKIFGIYAGWRGQSLNAGYLSNLTFWNREAAAHRVALGSIRELLGRAKALRDTIDRTTWSGSLLAADAKASPDDPRRTTRLLTIGHSFGGLIVYTALAQYFTDRAAASATAVALDVTDDADKQIAAYGDLVVIVNPAVEAITWEPIRQLMQDRPARDYARWQRPALVEVTSSADDATGIAFPLGHSFDIMTQDFTSDDQRQEATTALGHYRQFLTHDLTSAPDAVAAAALARADLAQATPAQATSAAGELVRQECESKMAFDEQWRRDGYLQPSWSRHYTSGAVLSQRANSRFDANDPYWVVYADASVIAGHSDISSQVFVDFIRQLYDDLLTDKVGCDPTQRQSP